MSDITVQRKDRSEPGAMSRREWDPVRAMRDILNWDPFREMAPLLGGAPTTYAAPFEVKETKDAYVFKADVPGLKEQDLEVSLTGNRLSISGKREAEKEEKGDTYFAFERSYGNFTRTFTLPNQTDPSHVRDELKDGELTVVVPKAPAAVAKRIPVGSGENPKT